VQEKSAFEMVAELDSEAEKLIEAGDSERAF